MNWNKKEHDFGIVANNTTNYTSFEYLGTEDVERMVFETSCGCTSGEWNKANKVYSCGILITDIKIATVTVHYPNGIDKEILVLKGHGQ